MALIPKVGRKSGRVRLFTALVYFLLIVGGATMIYPFLLMVSGSFKSDVDINNYNIIPRYFFDNEVLYRKYLESKYDESLTQYNMNSRQKVFGFGKIRPPDRIHQGRVSDWREFLEQTDVPLSYSTLGHSQSVGNRLLPEMARGYKGWIQEESNGDIETFNERYDAHIRSWLEVFVPKLLWGQRKFRLSGSRAESALLEYKSRQESRHLYYLSLDGKYVQDFLYYKYGKKIKDYNQAHGSQYQSYSEIFLSSRMPEDGKEKEDWMEFVKNELNLQFILVSLEARDEFSEFLRERYEGEIGVLNSTYESNFATFSEVPYPEDVLYAGERVVDWDIFVRQVLPKYLSIKSTELFWRKFLEEKYAGDMNVLNAAHEAGYESLEKISMPTQEVDYDDMLRNSRAIRWEFASRNYKMVIQYLILHGRGIWNTFIFCALSILIALIVNPSAAYAMSRFNLPSTYKILLFLMATMAFPPMVTTIPNFLLLKELGLLNTFWALVLPGMANGFSIFLLKGFFDSLPRELYESGMIDGAGEWVMFWNITMTLSKPILAVVSLAAFTGAYGAFMFAFIVCQDQKMWTLMVWLYQLQQYSHQSVTFAALIIAAIPTFLVFLFSQNIIMRGIVVPTEK